MLNKLTDRQEGTRKARELVIRQEPGAIVIEGTHSALEALRATVEDVARCYCPEKQTVLPDGRALRVVRWPED
jgi:hypothetical protein